MSKAVVPSSIVSEVLEGDNYEDWSETIKAYLTAQDLWDVVKSSVKPSEEEAQLKAWEKKNAAALHAIRISCGTKTLHYIKDAGDAHVAWSCLRDQLTNQRSLWNNLVNDIWVEEITHLETSIAGENVAYKNLDDAFSKRDFSAAIDLCKNNPLLLTRTLPNLHLVINELIKLGGCGHQQKVVEILQYDWLPNYNSQITNSKVSGLIETPFEVAVRMGAIEIASCLAEKEPKWLSSPDALNLALHLTPQAEAIGSRMNKMANLLYDLTPPVVWDDAMNTATVIIKSFEAGNLDIAFKLLRSSKTDFILSSDVYNKFPLCAAARAPHLFRRTYHHRFLRKCICKVLGPRLPLGSINFEISGMDILVHLGNAIRDSSHENFSSSGERTKIDIISEAFFEAIKHENFNFILMLIYFMKHIVFFRNNELRSMYMVAIKHRCPKIFSLFFWDKRYQLHLNLSDKWGNNLLHMVGASMPPIALGRISKPALQMKRELMWFKELEKLLPEMVKKSKNCDGKTPHELFKESHEDLMMEAGKWMKESASSWAIVGPLIITIMFAAAFQVPGGSLQDKGYPVFLEEWLFKVYMVLVAMSLFSATISVLKFLEILSANCDEDFFASLRTYNVITGTVILSLATMLIAFCVGLFLTLHGELAIFLPIAAIATFLVSYIISIKHPLLAESLNCFTFEEVKIPFIKWRTSIFDRNIGHEVELIFKMLNRDGQQR